MRKRGLILKSTLFILKVIQDIVVIESGAKPVMTHQHNLPF